MVEPIFRLEDLQVTSGSPVVYDISSAGSGKLVRIHFCQKCGTKLYLTFERFAETCGVYAGTFDDPNWFTVGADTSRHIYVDVARHDTILPAGVELSYLPKRVRVSIRDDGRGFVTEQPWGMGLAGMRERALLIGADLTVSSTLQNGCTVEVSLSLS